MFFLLFYCPFIHVLWKYIHVCTFCLLIVINIFISILSQWYTRNATLINRPRVALLFWLPSPAGAHPNHFGSSWTFATLSWTVCMTLNNATLTGVFQKGTIMPIGKHTPNCDSEHLHWHLIPTILVTHEGISDHDVCPMTAVPVVRPSGWFWPPMGAPKQRVDASAAQEAAQLPKTYPIQLGLAYLLLVGATQVGENMQREKTTFLDVFFLMGMIGLWFLFTL